MATPFLHVHLVASSAVEVNFIEDSYTVAESDGQVSVSLRIYGKFFVPVWAVVEISSGSATGGLCKYINYKLLCMYLDTSLSLMANPCICNTQMHYLSSTVIPACRL